MNHLLSPDTGRTITDEVGMRYGRFVVLAEGPRVQECGRPRRTVQCLCDCGVQKTVRLPDLKRGTTASCGCQQRENSLKALTKPRTHGLTHHPLYQTWKSMRQRCHDVNASNYKRYGAKGISVCEEWRNDFPAFLAHVGPRPAAGMSIDRIDNKGNYEPGNVRWATAKEQAMNRARRSA